MLQAEEQESKAALDKVCAVLLFESWSVHTQQPEYELKVLPSSSRRTAIWKSQE